MEVRANNKKKKWAKNRSRTIRRHNKNKYRRIVTTNERHSAAAAAAAATTAAASTRNANDDDTQCTFGGGSAVYTLVLYPASGRHRCGHHRSALHTANTTNKRRSLINDADDSRSNAIFRAVRLVGGCSRCNRRPWLYPDSNSKCDSAGFFGPRISLPP